MSNREYAKNLFGTWSDEDFCNQPVFDKLLYQVLSGQRAVNAAGIQPINFTRWRKAMRDGDVVPTEAAVRAALARMEHRRYVFLDEDTGELLIRSRMRRDELDKQPTVFLAALRLLAVLDSPKFAWVLASELNRMDIPVVKSDKAYAVVLRDNLAQAYPDAVNHLKALAEQYVPGPDAEDEGPSTGGSTGPSVSGYVSGSLPLVSTHVGDSRAHTREAPAASEPPADDPEPPARCKAHRDLPADAEVPACGPCANFSRAHAAWEIRDRRRTLAAQSEHAHAQAAVKSDAIAACTMCDSDGYRLPTRTTVCDHTRRDDDSPARAAARAAAARKAPADA